MAGAALSLSPARQDPVSDLFPVLAFDPDGKRFLLDDGSLGFGFECLPATAAQGVAEGLNVLLNLPWPAQTLLQFSLWASPDIETFLAAYQNQRFGLRDPTLQAHVSARVEFLRAGTRTPLEPHSGLRARQLQLLITAKLPLAAAEPSAREYAQASELRHSAEQCLRTAGFGPIALEPEGYLRGLSSLLNWGEHAAWRELTAPLYDCRQLLREQLLDYDTDLRIDTKGLWLGSKRVTLLSVKRLPEEVYLGTALRYLGDPTSGTRGVRDNLLITATLHFPAAESARSRLETQRQWIAHQAYGPLYKWAPKLGIQKDGFDTLLAALDDGDRAVQLYLSFVLFSDSEDEAIAAASNLQTFYRLSGLQVLPDRFFCLPLFLNSLPFGADRQAVKHLRRYRTLATRHAIPLLPVFGDWQGTGTPALSLLSRNGQVMGLSLFDSGSNYNAVIAAASGKGKSFLTNEWIDSYLGMGARVWVIDVGRSYQKLATALGGEFLAFTQSAEHCLNPFPLVGSYEEEADILVGLLTAMAAPSEALSNLQTAELKRVLRAVWDQQGKETTVDAIAQVLLAEPDRRVRDLGRQLYPFTRAGEYGRFFNGPNTVHLDNTFGVLELEELKGRKHLQQVVLLQIIYQIQQLMYQRQDERDRPKLVLIDEAWELLTQGDIAKFIETGYRRFRKYGGAAVTITQGVEDLYSSPSGRAIAENSANLYLLGQKPEAITALEKAGRLPLTPAGYALLKSVHTEPGAYSEILCLTERGLGIGRLIVDPYKRLLYSTRAEDVAAINALLSQGLTQTQAIQTLLRQGAG
ncbi:MAG: type IV secretion system protein TraC [Candidatus Competibacteraceae bacterium]